MHRVPLTLTSRTATKPHSLKALETWKQWQCLGNSLPLNIPSRFLIPSPPLNSSVLVCLLNYYYPLEVRFCLLSYCSMWDLEFCPAIPHISDYHQPSKLLSACQVNFKSKCKSPWRQVGCEVQQETGETQTPAVLQPIAWTLRVLVLADPACRLAGAFPSSRGHKDAVSQEFCVQSSKMSCLCELFYQIWRHLIGKTHLK